MTRLLPRATASSCSPTARWPAASSPRTGSASPSPRPATIADWSKMKYKRFIDQIGGWAVLQGILARARRGRDEARRLDRQRRDALGARAAGGRRRHRRRAARRERAPRRQSARCSRFALDDDDRARHRRGAGGDAAASPAIAATSTAGRPSSRPPAISATISTSFPKVYQADAGARTGPDRHAHRHRQRVGADLRLQPRGADRRPHPGQRHDGDARRRRDRSARAIRSGQTVYILDKIAASIEALGGSLEDVVRTRIYLRDAVAMGAGRPRPWPLSSAMSARPTRWSRSRASSATTTSRSRRRRWSATVELRRRRRYHTDGRNGSSRGVFPSWPRATCRSRCRRWMRSR